MSSFVSTNRKKRKRKKYEPFTAMEDTKCSRMPSDELTVPLIYWSAPPEHAITAVLVHDSVQFGRVLITGSERGEFVIWRLRSMLDPEDEDDDVRSEWVAMAMSFSTNSTAIISMVGLVAWNGSNDEGAFCAVHGDGEMVLFSVSGSGALRICRSARPLLGGATVRKSGGDNGGVAVQRVYGLKKDGPFWEWVLCTEFQRGVLRLLDLKTMRELKGFNLMEQQRIVDLAVFHLDWRRFVVIDAAGKLIVFQVMGDDAVSGVTLRRTLSAQSRFRKEAVAVTVTADDQYIVAVTSNEMALFSASTLSRIWSKTEKEVEWDGMTAIDDLIGPHPLSSDSVDATFLLFLWESNADQITMYAVSKERALLTPTMRLCISGEDGVAINWNPDAITKDKHALYIGTVDGELIAFSIDKLAEMAMHCLGTQRVDTLKPIHCGKIENSFGGRTDDRNLNDIELNHEDALHFVQRMDESRTLLIDAVEDIESDDSLQNESFDRAANDYKEKDGPSCCCMERTARGVMLCSGYRSGEVTVQNVTQSESTLEIHSRNCAVTAVLILCIDVDGGSASNGVVFIGYIDGFIEIFECDSGHNLFSKQTHFGAIDRLLRFDHDFYVFSIGSDHAVCCFLVWSQCHSLKAILHQIHDHRHHEDHNVNDDGNELDGDYGDRDGVESLNDNVFWRSFRGHHDRIRSIFRTKWCLVHDFVAIELEDGQIVVWNVATTQIERRFDSVTDAVPFAVDQSLAVSERRVDFMDTQRLGMYSVYDLHRSSGHLGAHPVVLDVAAVLKQSRNEREEGHHGFHGMGTMKSAEHLVAALSLLMDWDIHSDAVHFEFIDHFRRCLLSNQLMPNESRRGRHGGVFDDEWTLSLVRDIRPCFGYFGDYGSMTMLFPICSRNGGKWKMHHKFTAIYSTALRALAVRLQEVLCPPTMTALNGGRLSVTVDGQREKEGAEMVAFLEENIVHFYGETVPQSLSGFVEPSKKRLFHHCLSSTPSIRKAAKFLMENIVRRMTPYLKRVLITKWRDRFEAEMEEQSKSKRRGSKFGKVSNPTNGVDDDEKTESEAVTESVDVAEDDELAMLEAIESAAASRSFDPSPKYDLGGNERPPLSVLFNAMTICIIHSQQMDDLDQIATAALKGDDDDDLERAQREYEVIGMDQVVAVSVLKVLMDTLRERGHRDHIESDQILKSLCCYYLGRVITSWTGMLSESDFVSVLNLLLDLCSDSDGTALAETASWALIECGAASPTLFVETMGAEALSNSNRGRHSKALQAIKQLIYWSPRSMIHSLPFTVKTIIRCLEPSHPQKRKLLLRDTTSTLHALIQQFANCSFDRKSQRFAIGTGSERNVDDNELDAVIIYDLRTATRFGRPLKLKSHRHKVHDHGAKKHRRIKHLEQQIVGSGAVTAVEFSGDGNHLVSYSPHRRPPVLAVWKLSANDGVMAFFGSHSKCTKTIELEVIADDVVVDHLLNTKLKWDENKSHSVVLQREDLSVCHFKVL